jgi:acyl dehydratase
MEQNVEKSKKLEPSKVIGFKSKVLEFPINSKNTIIYALSIGFNQDPMNKKEFKFTYELSDDFSVFPTYSSVIPLGDLADVLGACPGIPDFNMMSLLHGEEWIEFIKPLPTSGTVLYQSEIVDLEDKGKGTVICIQIRVWSKEDNTLLSIITCNLFVRGLKGEGIKSVGPLKTAFPKVPKDKPTKEVTIKTTPNQALYYRIGGNDPNPLHVDPDMSIMGGFEKPILHGMCFYGIAAKAAYDLFCTENIENLATFKARLTSHVIPGESLTVQFWKGSSINSLVVVVKNVERGTQCLVGEITLKNSKF